MYIKRRLFISSLLTTILFGSNNQSLLAHFEKLEIDESSISDVRYASLFDAAINFFDEFRSSLTQEGIRIDKKKLIPTVFKLNKSVEFLLGDLMDLRKVIVENEDFKPEIRAQDLELGKQRMLRDLQIMIDRMSPIDAELRFHDRLISRGVKTRSGVVDRTIEYILSSGWESDKQKLIVKLDEAIRLGESLLISIQKLNSELD